MPASIHPESNGARIARSLRFLKGTPGWWRTAQLLAKSHAGGQFQVDTGEFWYAGDLSSFLDREVYLFGGYESDMISQFLGVIPENRRNVILDVGANVGTHSLPFSRVFKNVHSFEPNIQVHGSFEKNVALNGFDNIHLHKLALSDADSEMTLYSIAKDNLGLGTLSRTEQYDLPLTPLSSVNVVHGGKYLDREAIKNVDAIKIDVQGFEIEVLSGLRSMLATQKPYVWVEYGEGTKKKLETRADLMALFPYPATLHVFSPSNGLLRREILTKYEAAELLLGNYVICPIQS